MTEDATTDDATDDADGAELGRVLEALLLVVDTPVSVEALASATEQPVHRVTVTLQSLAGRLDGSRQRDRTP